MNPFFCHSKVGIVFFGVTPETRFEYTPDNIPTVIYSDSKPTWKVKQFSGMVLRIRRAQMDCFYYGQLSLLLRESQILLWIPEDKGIFSKLTGRIFEIDINVDGVFSVAIQVDEKVKFILPANHLPISWPAEFPILADWMDENNIPNANAFRYWNQLKAAKQLGNIIGKWPGNETDEEIQKALEELS